MSVIFYENAQHAIRMIKNRESGLMEVADGIFVKLNERVDGFPSIDVQGTETKIKDARIGRRGYAPVFDVQTREGDWITIGDVML